MGAGGCEWETAVFRVGFFSWCSGVIRGVPIWSGCSAVFGFVRICSGLFRVVRDAPEGLTTVSFVNPCQPGVNLCHGLVTVGQGRVAWLWGEGHGSALLFWYEYSGGWGEWGMR